MQQSKKIGIVILLAVFALCSVFFCVKCVREDKNKEPRDTKEIIKELTNSYGTYGDDAQKTIDDCLKELDEKDHVAGDKWRSIISLWKYSNKDLVLHYDVLPDGLPTTDELCIVVLGYQLNVDGTMRKELIGRLEVAKSSAEKYPNALIVCTGGHTAYQDSEASEAGRMSEWLKENGISGDRIIVEDNSLTTAQNAMFSIDILSEKYPQVTKLAIVSSDYHIATGNLLFGARSILLAEKAGEEKYEVISNAAYKASTGSLSTTFQAVALSDLSRTD